MIKRYITVLIIAFKVLFLFKLQTSAEESVVLTETVLWKTVSRCAPAQTAGAAQLVKTTSMSALKTLVSKAPLVLILKADLNVFAKLVLMVTDEKMEMDVMVRNINIIINIIIFL